MDEAKKINLPLDPETVAGLRAGDLLRLSGPLLTARDAAHKRLIEGLARGEAPPVDLAGQVIYYVGPAPAKAGRPIGPAGPTTSGRMDPYTLPLLELGVRGLIGKGFRSPEIVQALIEHRAVYLAAVGGAAALLARHILASEVVAYPDLGAEAMHALIVADFPAIVIHDITGGDAYRDGRDRYREGENPA